jgi:uridine kinase
MKIYTNQIIISICGGSGCGKSILTKHLAEQLGAEQAVRIPSDFYLKSNPYFTLAEFFRHPLQYDWDLLENALCETDGSSINSPNYDFIHFQRISGDGGRPFILRPIRIIDAMVPYPKAAVTVLLKVPEEERRRRIIERDKVWQTRVIDYWDLHQITLADMLFQKPRFDLELDGMESIHENAEKIIALLESQ